MLLLIIPTVFGILDYRQHQSLHALAVALDCPASVCVSFGTRDPCPSWGVNEVLQRPRLTCKKLRGMVADSVAELVLARTDVGNGTISTHLGRLTHLSAFVVGSSNVTGSIPTEIAHLTRLTELMLAGNRLIGAIPSELGAVRTLQFLSLEGNALSGTLPCELDLLQQLQWLDLSQNHLIGPVSPVLERIPDICRLYGGFEEDDNCLSSCSEKCCGKNATFCAYPPPSTTTTLMTTDMTDMTTEEPTRAPTKASTTASTRASTTRRGPTPKPTPEPTIIVGTRPPSPRFTVAPTPSPTPVPMSVGMDTTSGMSTSSRPSTLSVTTDASFSIPEVDDSPATTAPSSSAPSSTDKYPQAEGDATMLIMAGAGGCVLLTCVLGLCWFVRARKKRVLAGSARLESPAVVMDALPKPSKKKKRKKPKKEAKLALLQGAQDTNDDADDVEEFDADIVDSRQHRKPRRD